MVKIKGKIRPSHQIYLSLIPSGLKTAGCFLFIFILKSDSHIPKINILLDSMKAL